MFIIKTRFAIVIFGIYAIEVEQLKIWITWFMMFPDELKNAGGLTKWQRWKFSCLHFVMKNKDAMIVAYINDVLSYDELKGFKKIIDS